MIDLLKSLCIEGAPKTHMVECLLCYDKDQLIAIAEDHHISLDDSISIAEIAEMLIPSISKNTTECLAYLLPDEYTFLQKIIEHPEQEMDDIRYGECYNLVQLGYVFLFIFNDHVYPVVPDELRPVISDAITSDLLCLMEHHQQLFRYIKAFLNLYGGFEISHLIIMWNQLNARKISPYEVAKYMEAMSSRQGYFWLDGHFVISDSYFDGDEFYELLDKTEHLPYFIPKKSEIAFYSENEFDQRSIQYRRIEEFIRTKFWDSHKKTNVLQETDTTKNKKDSLDAIENHQDRGVTIESIQVIENANNIKQGRVDDIQVSDMENELEDILCSISNACIMDTDLNEFIEELLNDGMFFTDLDDVNKFTKLFMDLSNNTRKWVLRGFTPSELFLKNDRPALRHVDSTPVASNAKTRRNDSCPCGSGLKYKKCCGK
jgi:phage pi2 protein 07